MILHSLNELYDRLSSEDDYMIAPPGYSLQKISFRVVLHSDGRLAAIEDIRTVKGSRKIAKQLTVPGSAKPPGSALNPCAFWDNTAYMLGYKPDDPNPKRTFQSFNAFREKQKQIQSEVQSPSLAAVCTFLDNWNPEEAVSFPVLEEVSTGFGVFQILGHAEYVHEMPEVLAWWDAQQRPSTGEIGNCLITGEVAQIARTHQKVKGVIGAQGAGAAIVSFNETAYESYGRRQSTNAPVSELAAFRYTTSLNALLDGPMRDRHRVSLGDTTVAFWTERPTFTESIFAPFISEGSSAVNNPASQDEATRAKLEAFLDAIRAGRERYAELEEDPEQTGFFILGLAPNAARISVRFFHSGKLANLLDNLRRHFADIRTTPQPPTGSRREDPEFPPLWMLLRQTARDSKEIPPVLAGPLLRAVVTGARYPDALFSAVIRRIRADHTVNYPRACVIKGHLVRNLNLEVSMSLDTTRTDPAYRLGRLFAALEKTQADALGSVGASIRDRFYGAASATPQSVFPRLLRTYQHHLGKLERGRKTNRERLVQEILDPLGAFPAHLNLADQGLFAIGYYHQTRDFYTKKRQDD